MGLGLGFSLVVWGFSGVILGHFKPILRVFGGVGLFQRYVGLVWGRVWGLVWLLQICKKHCKIR